MSKVKYLKMVEDFFQLRKQHIGADKISCNNADDAGYSRQVLIYPLGQIVTDRFLRLKPIYSIPSLLEFFEVYFRLLFFEHNDSDLLGKKYDEEEGHRLTIIETYNKMIDYASDFISLYVEYKDQILVDSDDDIPDRMEDINAAVNKKLKTTIVQVGDILKDEGLPNLVISNILNQAYQTDGALGLHETMRLLESRMGADEKARFKDA